ncbi:MAG TPA: peptidylprolyl isomerase [Sphingobacteriaceae bacterium]|nr:peptidylprolyl isomerase [Sphingobacteriaceae bacterium]
MLITGLSACKKRSDFDPEKQAALDEQEIQKFITAKNLNAQQHSTGLYYVISNPGSGNITYNANTTVKVKYTGRFLSGGIFEQNTIEYAVRGFIDGWKIGIPLIQKGGKIRLLIPSGLAYGEGGQGSIPGNTVLDFDIELLDVTN